MNIAHTPVTDIIRYRRRPEGPRVLDLGCGDGERAIALAGRRFNRVTGGVLFLQKPCGAGHPACSATQSRCLLRMWQPLRNVLR